MNRGGHRHKGSEQAWNARYSPDFGAYPTHSYHGYCNGEHLINEVCRCGAVRIICTAGYPVRWIGKD